MKAKFAFPSSSDFAALIKGHLSTRPVVPHLLVWLLIGIALGCLLAPDLQISSLIAFTISGTLVSIFLGVCTYPLSRNHRLTLMGATTGVVVCLLLTVAGWELGIMTLPMGLMIGAIMGGTCFVWMAPTLWLLSKLTLHRSICR